MGKSILVTGGARSGKSSFAENLASSYGEKVLYLATAVAFDEEMQDRINKHREKRLESWTTIEEFKNLSEIIKDKGDRYDCILLDCITVMLTNIMMDYLNYKIEDVTMEDYIKIEDYLKDEVNKIMDAIDEININGILVTNEIGYGIVPENLMGRVFRDISGRINQILGRRSSEAYLVTCGIPIRIKG